MLRIEIGSISNPVGNLERSIVIVLHLTILVSTKHDHAIHVYNFALVGVELDLLFSTSHVVLEVVLELPHGLFERV